MAEERARQLGNKKLSRFSRHFTMFVFRQRKRESLSRLETYVHNSQQKHVRISKNNVMCFHTDFPILQWSPVATKSSGLSLFSQNFFLGSLRVVVKIIFTGFTTVYECHHCCYDHVIIYM